jgi:class 3 adenylate cyclase
MVDTSRDDLTALLQLWRDMNSCPSGLAASPRAHQSLGEKVLRMGEPLVAYDVMTRGLELWPGDVRLRQLQALALARSGAGERAANQLMQLREEGHADEETLGLLARTSKDLGLKTADPDVRRNHFRRAFELYSEAYRHTGGGWTGINAATMALTLGDVEGARELAGAVRLRCQEELKLVEINGGDAFWLAATLGEAALILGDWSEAMERYASLSELAPERFGDLSSTRRNARLILDCLGADRAFIDRCFHLPRVVLFYGGSFALRTPTWRGWPHGLEEQMRDVIGARLREVNGHIGYSSAVCVPDLLFLEALLESGSEAHVVFPYDREQLLQDWGENFPKDLWGDRYDRAVNRAEVLTASAQRMRGNIAYEYAHKFLTGLAGIRARQLETGLVRWVAAQDAPGAEPGDPTGAVQDWSALGHDVEVLDLDVLMRRAGAAPGLVHDSRSAPPPVAAEPAPAELTSRIAAIFFGDVAGFSKLTEEQSVGFVRHFLQMVAMVLKSLPAPPLVKNTWGDGLYLVLANMRDAGNLALDLCDHVTRTDWQKLGLPASLGLRIALHAGPVFECIDPVTEQFTCIGTHVSQAARIEPITPPNQVYASRGFAALAAAEGLTDFLCEYMGQTPLAKGYGVYPIYHVRRNEFKPA